MGNFLREECSQSLKVHKKWQIHFKQLLILFSYKIFNKYDFSKKNIARNTSKKHSEVLTLMSKVGHEMSLWFQRILQMNEIWWFAFLNEEPFLKKEIK